MSNPQVRLKANIWKYYLFNLECLNNPPINCPVLTPASPGGIMLCSKKVKPDCRTFSLMTLEKV